ncbi:unnamed protein product [Cylicostephanus goldi]|uniref:Uncharacterized protein n=1 Tax=Cylicostephanus goldi TaxID=71465 RepID=A0A3P6S7Q9_CYLGO|nr:unnamed protein product [Cylicostephanus goldi]
MRFPVNLHLDHPSLEQISIKRVKSVEKNCIFPSMGLIFIRGQLFEKDHGRYSDPEGDENSGNINLFLRIKMDHKFKVVVLRSNR